MKFIIAHMLSHFPLTTYRLHLLSKLICYIYFDISAGGCTLDLAADKQRTQIHVIIKPETNTTRRRRQIRSQESADRAARCAPFRSLKPPRVISIIHRTLINLLDTRSLISVQTGRRVCEVERQLVFGGRQKFTILSDRRDGRAGRIAAAETPEFSAEPTTCGRATGSARPGRRAINCPYR